MTQQAYTGHTGPYIVTTRRTFPPVDLTDPDYVSVSLKAVATLDEARGEVQEAWRQIPRRPTPLRTAIQQMVPERGGSVGPLPDGTVIEVEPTTLIALRESLPVSAPVRPPEIIAAYNAAQAEGLMT